MEKNGSISEATWRAEGKTAEAGTFRVGEKSRTGVNREIRSNRWNRRDCVGAAKELSEAERVCHMMTFTRAEFRRAVTANGRGPSARDASAGSCSVPPAHRCRRACRTLFVRGGCLHRQRPALHARPGPFSRSARPCSAGYAPSPSGIPPLPALTADLEARQNGTPRRRR